MSPTANVGHVSAEKVRRVKRGAPIREVGSWLYNLEARLLFGVRAADVKGHTVTSRYMHPADAVLLAAADKVANETAKRMGDQARSAQVVPMKRRRAC